MSLATRCNAYSYCMFVIAIHVMSSNFSITYEFLTKLWGQMCTQGYFSKGSPQGVGCL